MQITDFNYIKTSKTPAEYTIYSYDKFCENKIGHNKWRCLSSGQDAAQALQQAQVLFNSSQYQKIEIKKKFFDQKKKRYAVSTFRVLDKKTKKVSAFVAMTILILGLLCGGLFALELL